MGLVLVIIAALLIVAAVRDTQGDLFEAIKTDVPAYATWAAALVALGILGFIPGMKVISRGLILLVIVVLAVNNGPAIVAGFESAWGKKDG